MGKAVGSILKVGAAIAGVAAVVATGGAALGLIGPGASLLGLGVSAGGFGLIASGLALGGSLLAGKPKSLSVSPASTDRLQASINLRAPRVTVFGGPTAMATDIRDQEWSSDQAYLHRFIVCASHRVRAIREIWFDDKMAWSAGGGVTTTYAGYLTVTPVLEGSAGNAINIGPRMGSSRRYTGCAYAYLRYKLTGNDKKTDSPFAGGSIPSRMTIIGDGIPVPDPRASGFSATDQATWSTDAGACRNPALVMLAYLLGWKINGKLAVGKGIPPARIDLASFAAAANICDEPVTRPNGTTEPRYRCDGVISEGDDTSLVLDNLKATMNAVLDDVDGKIRLSILYNDLATPIGDLTAADVLGDFSWDQTAPLSDSVNVIRGGYTDPSTTSLYQMVDYPEVRIPSPDGIDRVQTINLPLVQSAGQAQRLAKLRLARFQYGGTFTAVFQATAWKFQKGDVIRLSFYPLGWDRKLFRIADMAIQVDGTVPMMLREEHPAIYAAYSDEAAPIAGAAPTTYDPQLWPVIQGIIDVEAQIARAVSDGWLDPSEKRQAKIDYDQRTAQRDALQSKYVEQGSPADATNARNAAFDKVQALYSYLQGLSPSWLDYSTTSQVPDPAAYQAAWKAASDALENFGVAITGRPGKDAPLVLIQWSVDGSTNWHFDYAEGDKFQRQSNDNGATWGPAVRVVGESATSGQDGISPSIVFRRSATIPATPARDTGNPPTGWFDDPPAGTDFLWQSVSKFRNAMQLEDWSAPVRITGPAGQDGASAFTLRNIVNTTVESASITKTGGASGQWDAKARTLESGANVTVGGLLPKGSFLGLTTDPEANNSFDTIDYTWHRSGDPNYGVGVFRNGVSLVNTPEIGDQYAASVFTTTVRDGIVIYAREGIEYYRHSAAAASETLYGVAAIANVGASIRGVTFAVNGKAGEPGLSAPLVRTQWSVDGVSNWHDNYMGADLFYRQSNDNGVTWGPAIRGVGESGTGVAVAFRRSATVPPTPPSNTGNPPSGWNDGPPAGTDFLWLIKANFVNGTQQTAWSSPQRISGEDGFVLSVNPPAFVVPAFSNGTAKPSWTGGSCVLSLNKGGQAITPDGGYSIAAQNGVASLTISGNTATFAGILADKAEFTVRATHQGKAYDQRVTLVRARDGEAAFKGSVNLSGSGSFATPIVVGSGVSVVPAGRGTIISGYGDYFVNQAQPGNFQGRLYLYWRNVTDNGAWNLLGSETGSFSTSTNVGTPSEPEYQVSYGTVSASFGFIAPASGDKQIAFEARLERASGALGADMTGQLKLEVSS